jgi:hypothetical protein
MTEPYQYSIGYVERLEPQIAAYEALARAHKRDEDMVMMYLSDRAMRVPWAVAEAMERILERAIKAEGRG